MFSLAVLVVDLSVVPVYRDRLAGSTPLSQLVQVILKRVGFILTLYVQVDNGVISEEANRGLKSVREVVDREEEHARPSDGSLWNSRVYLNFV